ncbi:hypothetical protein AWC38_SpisGene22743 [Stylophora pistillata]|uniref:PHD-type domain-containing protein n=1 Tax=Stylophora pistillata TaxID=50429 RepID=A0A2B4RA83_STYPI|nr:hypothetical protein AWC38_SpisGene22743 [Stylophora pistillata]
MPKESDGEQCDSCDKWFHAKCISMKRTEYDELCEPSLAWECITCLSLGFDTPVRKSHEKIDTGVKEGKPSGSMNKDLHANLKKRGLKFPHVNIATFPGHCADAVVLMEKAALDVFAVTESRLDCTLLDINKAVGLHRTPARLLKDAEAELDPSITYLVNRSISNGVVPELWKVARVTPLYKSDDKLQVENYRPISVLPVLSKVV